MKTLCFALLILAAVSTMAQDGRAKADPGQSKGQLPAQSVLDAELKRVEQERKRVFDPMNPAAAPTNSFPNIEVARPSDVDIEQVVRRYEQKSVARKADGLLAFASFGMSKASLRKLIADANAVGATVVLRGFKNGSLKETAQAISALGELGGNVQINPEAFTKYRITAVPTIVLVKDAVGLDSDGCALPGDFVAVAGDVGLGYSLEVIERRSAQFQAIAARYSRQLQGAAR
jgi:conjugal transfer pilus assembly protein TrbC